MSNSGVIRDNLVRELKMVHIVNVAIIATCAALHNPVHHAFILEQGPNTQIFCVSPTHFHVRRRPRNARSLAPPGNATPEVDTLLDAAFLAFVVRILKKEKKQSIFN